MRSELDRIWSVLNRHESKLRNINWEKIFKSIFRRKMRWERQLNSYYGIHLALCVDTRDPWKQNRVRYFSPIMHQANTQPGMEGSEAGRGVQISNLDWAWPISAMGGFDDCGMTWVPPVGSTICLLFQNGSPNTAFYIGTTWSRNKGPENNPNWGVDIPEYRKIWRSHRKGYMVGKNDESQMLPPWNTDNYQGLDIDTTVDTDLVLDAFNKTTWPHVYGFTTPEKHRLKMDDGDPKCNRRWKRLEIMSSMGHYFLMKDDPYHHCGEWINPKCQISHVYIKPEICTPSLITISVVDREVLISNVVQTVPFSISWWGPYPCQQGPEFCPVDPLEKGETVEDDYQGNEHLCPYFDPFPGISVTASSVPVKDCLGVLRADTDFCFSFNNDGHNRYHKHKQECFPFLNNRCGLPQSGMQLLARSGHTLVMDDSVERPRQRNEWERALDKFDMDGCTGVYKGRTYWRSATGHYIEMNDMEDNPKIRGPRNGIHIVTACGNEVCLNDHTKPCCVAGEHRGIHIKSTADHTLDFVDDSNQQCSPERDGCGKTGPYSKKAFVRLRSGGGRQILLSDANSQMKTDQGYLQLMAPQTDNLQRGPHILHMQERPTGTGQIFLRAGGDYIVYTYDNMVEVVGDEKDNPSNKMEFVSNMKIVSVKDVYYNKAKTHCFWADDFIFLLAGKDCAEDPDDPASQGTCVYPVVVAHQPIPEFIMHMAGIKESEHVFASAVKEPEDPCERIASDIKEE
jgi:hypothetical protein